MLGGIWLAMLLVSGSHACEPWPECAHVEQQTLARASATSLRAVTIGVKPDSQQLFEYSDGYATRLAIHRWSSYAMMPLFAAQVIIGEELLRDGPAAGGWAKHTHKPIALALGGLFVASTVTGTMNVMEARRDPSAGARPTLHTALMMLADAGMVWTGISASGAGKPGPGGRVRTTHRKTALVTMGIATVGFLMMVPPLRQD